MNKTTGERWHEESQELGEIEGLAIGALLLFGFLVFIFVGATSCRYFQEEPEVPDTAAKMPVSDILAQPKLTVSPVWEYLIPAEEQATKEEAVEEEYYEEEYYEPYYEEEYYDYGYSGGGSSDGFMQAGVRDGVDSDTETWYSSNQAYHYRTSEWSPDDEGYYRDSNGYYVVASSDYPEGTVIETSKGEAIVLDDGTSSGNVDFYVNW